MTGHHPLGDLIRQSIDDGRLSMTESSTPKPRPHTTTPPKPQPSPELQARQRADLQVERLVRAVRRDVRLGLMLGLDDNSMAGLIKQHREQTTKVVDVQRQALIDALVGQGAHDG